MEPSIPPNQEKTKPFPSFRKGPISGSLLSDAHVASQRPKNPNSNMNLNLNSNSNAKGQAKAKIDPKPQTLPPNPRSFTKPSEAENFSEGNFSEAEEEEREAILHPILGHPVVESPEGKLEESTAEEVVPGGLVFGVPLLNYSFGATVGAPPPNLLRDGSLVSLIEAHKKLGAVKENGRLGPF